MNKLFRYLVVHPLAALLVIVLIVIIALGLLAATETGSGAVVRLAERTVPGLAFEGVQGRLFDTIKADSLTWEEGDIKVTAEQLQLKGSVGARWPARVSVRDLKAKQLTIHLPPSGPDDGKPIIIPDLRLPIDLLVEKASIDELVIVKGETTTRFKNVNLDAYTRHDMLQVDNLSGELVDQGGNILLSLHGEMALAAPHQTQLQGSIKTINTRYGTGSLALKANGPLQDYDISVQGDWQYPHYPVYQVQAQGQGNFEQITIPTLQLQGDAGTILAQGKISWDPSLSWDAQATVTDLKPEYFSPDTQGLLSGRLTTKGQLEAQGQPTVQFSLQDVEGTVQDYPLSGQASGEYKQGALALHSLDVKVGDNHLQAQGSVDDDLAIEWNLDAPALHQLQAELSGHLQGKGRLSGALGSSNFAVDVTELKGQVLEYPIDAKGALSLQDGVVRAKQLQAQIGDNHLLLDGAADENEGVSWSLDAKNLAQLQSNLQGRLKGSGKAQGLLDGSRLKVQIDDLQGKLQGYPVKASGTVRLENQLLSAEAVKLAVGDNRLQLDGVANEAEGIAWQLDAKNLAQLNPQLKGRLQGSGNAKGLLDGSRLTVTIAELSGQLNDYPVNAVGEIKVNDQLLSAHDVKLEVGKNTLKLNGVADEKQGINWQLDAKNLAQLSTELKGRLQGQGNAQFLLDGSRLALRIENLDGNLNGYPLEAEGGIKLNEQQISANHLELRLGDNRLKLNGVADEKRGLDWQLDAQNLSQLQAELQGKLVGDGNAQLTLDGSRLALKINTLDGQVMDYPINATGEVRLRDNVLSAKNLQAQIGDNRIQLNGTADEKQGMDWILDARNLKQLTPELSGEVKGAGNLQGRLDGSRLAVNIEALNGTVQGYPIQAQGEIRLRNQVVSANKLQLSLGDNRVQLNGAANDSQGIHWTIDANNLSELSPELKGQVQGSGSAQGLLDGSKLTVQIADLQGQVQGYPIAATGEVRLRNQELAAKDLIVDIGQNRIRLNGNAGQQVGLNWELNAANLSQLVPQLNGSATGHGTLTGRIDGSSLRLQIAQLQGQLEGRTLQASGAVDISGSKLNIQGVEVVAGNNHLQLNGQASEPLNLDWRINAPNLAQAWPGLAGSLQGEGAIRGTLQQPDIQGVLQGRQLVYQDINIARLELQARQKAGQYDLKGSLDQLQQGSTQLQALDFALQGRLENHQLTATAVHEQGKLELRAQGGLQNEQWRGTVSSLSLRDTPAGQWQLTNPVTLTASATGFRASEACLANQQNARFCAQSSWSPQAGLTASGRLQQVPLNMARPFLPETVELAGVVNGTYEFEQRNGRPHAQADLQFPDSTITLKSGLKPEVLRYTQARANLLLNDQRADLNAQLDIVGRGQLRAAGQIQLAQANRPAQINAQVALDMPDISWLENLSPQIDELQGAVTGDVRISGALDNPQINGQIRLQNGSVFLPETGARLEAIMLTLQPTATGQMTIDGSLRAGDGTLTARGTLDLAHLPDWKAEVQLQGKQLLLMNTYEVQAQVSPELRVIATPKLVDVTGTLRIPEGTINLRELPEGAKVRSDDIIIVQNGQRQTDTTDDVGLDIQPDVLVIVGDKVRFNGFGLDARLTGQLRLLRNRQDVVGEGVLSIVDGYYKSYGQDLTLERGRIIFNGPLDNPGLDARAVRKVEDDSITVGITLGGTVQQPESVLFSSPVQTQSDTLSYLVTGRAVSNVSGSESALLMQAVTSLGITGGETLAQNLGNQLGLDDVNLDTGSNGDYRQSQLALGKRLGPKLYIKYIVGLFDSMQKAAITYEFNKKLRAEVTSGTEQSVDLIYKIDSNTGPFGE